MYCECGCGEKTKLAKQNDRKMGYVRGKPMRFIVGHNARLDRKPVSWNGGRSVTPVGYIRIWMPEHPRACNGYVLEHIVVVEKAMGKPLRSPAQVHHVNENKSDNRNSNLVVCPDDAYHRLLHQRQRAKDESGHANWLRCPHCKRWDAPENMYKRPRGNQAYHVACAREAKRKWVQERLVAVTEILVHERKINPKRFNADGFPIMQSE